MGIHFTVKIVLCSLLISKLVLSKKLSITDIDGQKSGKLNDCQRCNVLVDSFNYWLDKTSRGKFEGGDAAWEEAKLRSYARSEIRLVEIQEGLCSELKRYQDHCYSLSDEAEHTLETWWFKDDPNSADLHTWLCIKTLKACCPQNHFGVDCEPCPLDKNNRLCGGHGKCDGEGTRNGNGECVCSKRFTGKYCEECAKNFYSEGLDQCEPCHEACDGCSGEGTIACTACKPGWKLESESCVNVNECSDPTVCKLNQYCIDKEGSYSCKLCDKSCKTCIGPGVTNCTSCEPNLVLWSSMCVDDDLKLELLTATLNRVILYFILNFMALFISRTSIRRLVLLITAVYIYYSEKSSKMNFVDVIFNSYFNFNDNLSCIHIILITIIIMIIIMTIALYSDILKIYIHKFFPLLNI